MRRLQANFSRDLQNTLNLLEQSSLGSPVRSNHAFTHNKSIKQNPIQIVNTPSPHNYSKTKTRRQTSPSNLSGQRRRAPMKKAKRNMNQQNYSPSMPQIIFTVNPNGKYSSISLIPQKYQQNHSQNYQQNNSDFSTQNLSNLNNSNNINTQFDNIRNVYVKEISKLTENLSKGENNSEKNLRNSERARAANNLMGKSNENRTDKKNEKRSSNLVEGNNKSKENKKMSTLNNDNTQKESNTKTIDNINNSRNEKKSRNNNSNVINNTSNTNESSNTEYPIIHNRTLNRRSSRKRSTGNEEEKSLNSILRHPISSSDPNIQSMFSLFCLERKYRFHDRKKVLERVFSTWYKRMTRSIISKLRKSQLDSTLNLQSTTVNNIDIVTSNQLTQTEYMSGSDSNPFSLTDDPSGEIDDLSDNQLIDQIMKNDPLMRIFRQDNPNPSEKMHHIIQHKLNRFKDHNDDVGDNINDDKIYDDELLDDNESIENDRINGEIEGVINDEIDEIKKINRSEKGKSTENQNGSSFLSWKAENYKRAQSQSYEAVGNMIEVSNSENSQAYSETTEEYIPIPISSDHSETIDTSNTLNFRSRDGGSDSFSAELEESSNEFHISQQPYQKANQTQNYPNKLVNHSNFQNEDEEDEDGDDNLSNMIDQVMNKTYQIDNEIDFEVPVDIPTIDMKRILSSPERKTQPITVNSPNTSPNNHSLLNSNSLSQSLNKSPEKRNEAHLSLKERFRPPPINPNAEIIKQVVQEFKSTSSSQKSEQDSGNPTSKPETDLKRFLRQLFSESLFESFKSSQAKNKSIPKIIIPTTIQLPWQFNEEYCDLVVDVVTELAESTNVVNYTYETFLDYLSDFFKTAHYQLQKTVLPELEVFRQNKFDDFMLNYSIDFSDSLLSYQLDYVLGV